MSDLSDLIDPIAAPGGHDGGEVEAGGARRRGRSSARERPNLLLPPQPDWHQPRHAYPPIAAVSEDHLEAIHLSSLRILSEIGIDFLHEGARQRLADAGAEVDGSRVRFAPELIESLVSSAPASFTLHARNPQRHLAIGGDAIAFSSVASAPNAASLAGGRRAGNLTDFTDLTKLGHMLQIVHFWGGYPVEPVDVHASVRHLHTTFQQLTLSDKAIHGYSLGAQRNLDVLEMARIARGIDDATLDLEPSVCSVINASSPLRFDQPMLEGIIQLSARNQVIILTPFTLAGAMAPITLAGALAQQNAEALAGIAMTQVVRPGSPVLYGGFTSNVDMQSGAPAFGTPEFIRTAMVGGQLARRYGVPYRSSNVSASNAVDAQAGYESVFSLWGAIMGGANVVLHGAGWMEGGLHASFEKMVVDADLLQMIAAYLEPIVVDEDTLAFEAIREVGPGGHFFGTAHTQSRFRDAFYRPMVSDWRNYERWEEAGAPDAATRAAGIATQLIAAHTPPPMDPAIHQELEEFVARRVAEGGAPTDF
jgi:trimethylamine---corrinoid protein Co-methyltransferase